MPEEKPKRKSVIVWPDHTLAAVVGTDRALSREELEQRVWDYCKTKNLVEEK